MEMAVLLDGQEAGYVEDVTAAAAGGGGSGTRRIDLHMNEGIEAAVTASPPICSLEVDLVAHAAAWQVCRPAVLAPTMPTLLACLPLPTACTAPAPRPPLCPSAQAPGYAPCVHRRRSWLAAQAPGSASC
eukprot:scaffold55243_cov20-Tisochrysis_lutea.AAC.4